MRKNIANLVLFNAGWAACVIGGNLWAIWVVALCLLLHGFFISQTYREWLSIIICSLLGMAIDSAWQFFQVLQFMPAEYFIPSWLVGLWLLFATTLNHSLAWLQHRLILAACLGAVAGPLSYWAGIQLGGAIALISDLHLMILISLAWLLLLPIMLYVSRVNAP